MCMEGREFISAGLHLNDGNGVDGCRSRSELKILVLACIFCSTREVVGWSKLRCQCRCFWISILETANYVAQLTLVF